MVINFTGRTLPNLITALSLLKGRYKTVDITKKYYNGYYYGYFIVS